VWSGVLLFFERKEDGGSGLGVHRAVVCVWSRVGNHDFSIFFKSGAVRV